eukprot:2383165-Rhodomonas_salina.1
MSVWRMNVQIDVGSDADVRIGSRVRAGKGQGRVPDVCESRHVPARDEAPETGPAPTCLSIPPTHLRSRQKSEWAHAFSCRIVLQSPTLSLQQLASIINTAYRHLCAACFVQRCDGLLLWSGPKRGG